MQKRKREEVIPIARRRAASCQEERERERELGERVALEAGSEDAIIIAKEIKDASVKEKMPGLKKKRVGRTTYQFVQRISHSI